MTEVASDSIRQTLDEAKAFVNAPGLMKLSEADTRAYFIEPLIAALGWRGIGIVNREYRVKNSGEFIDYVMLEEGRLVLAVEAKSIQSILTTKDSSQLVQYCVIEGIQWAALTNGRELQFFNTYLTPDLDSKRILTFDLLSYDNDVEFTSVVQQLALLSRHSIISPNGAEMWLRQRRMDERLRTVLLDTNSAIAKAMRRTLDEVGIKTSPSEITAWVRSNFLKESPVIPQPKPPQPRPAGNETTDNNLDKGDEPDGGFDPASSNVFKGHEQLLPVLQALMDRINSIAPETSWRAKTRYIAASDKDNNTFLAILRRGERIVIGLALPDGAQHPRLRKKTWEFNWPRITRLLELTKPQEVDDEVLQLIREAMGNAPSISGASKRFYGATLSDLLRGGLLTPGERLFLMKGSQQIAEAMLTPSAQIDWQGRLFIKPSSPEFAQVMGNKSLNGWSCWHVERSGSLIPLSVLRDQLKSR